MANAKKSRGWGIWGWTWTTLAILWLLLSVARALVVLVAADDNPLLARLQMLSDGERGWVVGSSGAVLATVDGGKTWRSQSSQTEQYLADVYFSADGQRGWAVGDRGTVIATVNGGRTWGVQSSPTKVFLNSVYFAADGQHGWAVGDSGTVIATIDGGKTWDAQSSPTTAWLQSVYFAADGQHGWAVGKRGLIIATVDGGKTWVPQSSPTKVWLNSVYFTTDGQRGWVVGGSVGEWLTAGEDSPLITTVDGGETWVARAIPRDTWLTFVHFAADGQHGWAAGTSGDPLSNSGSHGLLMATVDGGQTWVAQTVPELDHSHARFTLDGQHIWALGPWTAVQASVDGGKNWSRRIWLTYAPEPVLWSWLTTLPALAMLALAAAPRFRRSKRQRDCS
jgi:photosystem II stability/assembly factor-like uncharacterized protein